MGDVTAGPDIIHVIDDDADDDSADEVTSSLVRHHTKMKPFICLSLLALAACRPVQVLEDGCGEPTCTPCSVDADCRVYSNPCSPTGTCGHVDADIAVNELGCDDVSRFEVPDDDECVCLTAGCAPR